MTYPLCAHATLPARIETLAELEELLSRPTPQVCEALARLEGDLLQVAPRRVIFNPGAENPDLAAALRQHGIECVEACTLVLLATDQF